MKKILFEDALILNCIKGARFFVRILPFGVCLRLGSLLGGAAWFFTKRGGVMRKNLRAVFSAEKSPEEMDRIAKDSFRQLSMSAIELLRVPEMNQAFMDKHVRVIGEEKLHPSLRAGKGVIFLTGHFGSWELLNIFGAMRGFPMVALARVQKHPRSDAYLNGIRRSKGSEVIYKGMPTREILRALKAGRIVGILSDQDGGKNGVFVPFFNRLSSYPKGVASFAMRTDALIFPTFIFREGLLNYRIEVEGPLEMPDASLTQEEGEKKILRQFAQILESKIRKAPGQWLWAHRRWKSTPDRTVVVLSDGKAGHRNQSLAFCEAALEARTADGIDPARFHQKIIEVRFKSERARKIYRGIQILFLGRAPWHDLWLKLFLDPASLHEIMSSYADVVVSAGSSMSLINRWMALENAARSVVVMNPGFSTRLFDAVIAPKHDRLGGKARVYETLAAPARGFSVVAGEKFHAAGGGSSGVRPIGLLIGGDTQEISFSPPLFEEMLRAVRGCADTLGAPALVTTSRRTPAWADSETKTWFSDKNACPQLVIANEANREGVVAEILASSEVILVTGESVSMVSEAVSSGKPVIVLTPFDPGALKPKYREFLREMQNQALLTCESNASLAEAVKRQWSRLSSSGPKEAPDRRILIEAARKMFQ